MKLGNIRYDDSYIFIGLEGSQEELESLKTIRNVYVEYAIKIFQQVVNEIFKLKSKDIISGIDGQYLKISLNQFTYPEDTEIKVKKIKITQEDSKSFLIEVDKTYPLFEILNIQKVNTNYLVNNFTPANKNIIDRVKKSSHKYESKKNIKSETSDIDKFEEKQGSEDDEFIIEDITPISKIVSRIESKMEETLDSLLNKLNLDIKHLSFGAIDLLLTSLPKPDANEDYKNSRAMIHSIHKYINQDLLDTGGEIE